MSWAQWPWGGSGYVGVPGRFGLPTGGVVIPDPGSETGTAQWFWTTQTGFSAYGATGWAGGGVAIPPGAGGIPTTNPDAGTVILRAWWPRVHYIAVTRIDVETGQRTPVRGAYPVTVEQDTRRNLSTNPQVSAALTGYASANGTPTLSQLTDDATAPGGSALRATATVAGEMGVVLAGIAPGEVTTIKFRVRASAPLTDLRLVMDWTSGGAAVATTSLTAPLEMRTQIEGEWGVIEAPVEPPAGSAQEVIGQLTLVATVGAIGDTVDLTQTVWEYGWGAGEYFDGNSFGGSWTANRGLSQSLLAPVLTIPDGEAPLDRPVRYELSSPATSSFRLLTNPVTLASRHHTFLTHPASPTTPVPCHVTAALKLSRELTQGTYQVIGRARPIVVSEARRRAPSGSLVLHTESFSERDRLLAMLDDGQPLLLRAPAELGYGPGLWIAVGDTEEEARTHDAGDPVRRLTCPFQEVDAPVGVNAQAVV